MELMRKLMLDCKQATLLISKSQEVELNVGEKLKLRAHLMACKYCNLFKKESQFLEDNISHMINDLDQGNTLSEDSKKALQEAIDAKLGK
ncbi:MAG: hypothetical protein IH948_00620 [Bacteroidetes bacterium]|nr:hypothetical protein [Bacteroidota bacterium]